MGQATWQERLNRRWDRRREAANTVESHAFEVSVVIAAEVETVWDFVTDPASNAALDQGFVKTFPVPGTPTVGVGHQYCNVYEGEGGNQTVLLTQIEELDRPKRLKRRILNSAADVVRILTLEKVDEGCRYTIRTEMRASTADVEIAGHLVEKKLQQTLIKVKQELESRSNRGLKRD